MVAARLAAPETLVYSPYPPNSLLPPFNPLVGAALLLLVLPALLVPQAGDAQQPASNTEYSA